MTSYIIHRVAFSCMDNFPLYLNDAVRDVTRRIGYKLQIPVSVNKVHWKIFGPKRDDGDSRGMEPVPWVLHRNSCRLMCVSRRL
jgi:hypothetical protein